MNAVGVIVIVMALSMKTAASKAADKMRIKTYVSINALKVKHVVRAARNVDKLASIDVRQTTTAPAATNVLSEPPVIRTVPAAWPSMSDASDENAATDSTMIAMAGSMKPYSMHVVGVAAFQLKSAMAWITIAIRK